MNIPDESSKKCIYIDSNGKRCKRHFTDHYLGYRMTSFNSFVTNLGFCCKHYNHLDKFTHDHSSNNILGKKVWALYFCVCLGKINLVNEIFINYDFDSMQIDAILSSPIRKFSKNINPCIIKLLIYRKCFPNYNFLNKNKKYLFERKNWTCINH